MEELLLLLLLLGPWVGGWAAARMPRRRRGLRARCVSFIRDGVEQGLN
jgi:hypothetical protein